MKDREPFPRGTVIGKQVDGPPLGEAEHYFKCETCGGFFDMRYLAQVYDHEGPAAAPGM